METLVILIDFYVILNINCGHSLLDSFHDPERSSSLPLETPGHVCSYRGEGTCHSQPFLWNEQAIGKCGVSRINCCSNIVSQQGGILRNASLGDCIIVRTSQSQIVLTQKGLPKQLQPAGSLLPLGASQLQAVPYHVVLNYLLSSCRFVSRC